jgi:hypothetical protein
MTPIPAKVLKNPGEFDWDVATVLNSNTNEAGPFDLKKIAQLPPELKKVLAMHYHEHIPLSDIAACFGVTESKICQIDAQIVALLRNYLWREPVSASFSQESDLAVLHPRRSASAKK